MPFFGDGWSLLVVFDVIFIAAGVALIDFLVEE